MTRAKSAFSELDSGIPETVKFRDGSEMCGTIMFIGKGGEHHKLTNVYFIPRLKANLGAWVNSIRLAATFPSSVSYSRSAMIDDGCSHKFNARQIAFTS